MAKLKFDRSVNVILKQGEKTTIPQNEIWKGSTFLHQHVEVNDIEVMPFLGQGKQPYSVFTMTLGGGTTITNGAIFTGVAFRIIE